MEELNYSVEEITLDNQVEVLGWPISAGRWEDIKRYVQYFNTRETTIIESELKSLKNSIKQFSDEAITRAASTGNAGLLKELNEGRSAKEVKIALFQELLNNRRHIEASGDEDRKGVHLVLNEILGGISISDLENEENLNAAVNGGYWGKLSSAGSIEEA